MQRPMNRELSRDWRTSNVKWRDIWILALGVVLAVLMATHAAPAAQDGMAGVFGGLFTGQTNGRAKVVATPQLVDVLETAKDGDVKRITLRHPRTQGRTVTYRVQPKSSFEVGERNCRTFVINAATETAARETFRIACRDVDGTWRVAAQPLGTGGAN